ncbi:MAG: Gfo/Idh/MocA family oxidoreductase, partial [Pseudomonadota bacterium]
MMTLKVAQIGCGYFGRFQLAAWLRLESEGEPVDFQGVADATPANRNRIETDFPGTTVHSSIENLMAENTYDIIDVVTPP